jgi:hypothetical protein
MDGHSQGAQSAKVYAVLRPIALQIVNFAHDLIAKPLTLWRIMRARSWGDSAISAGALWSGDASVKA